ncbi:MAG: amidohydrolase family protein [Actinomycetota bacterium]
MLLRGGVIEAIGRERDLPPCDDVPVTDMGDAILIPGLVDSHCHLEWALMGGLVPDARFGDWLGAFVHRTADVTPADRQAAARYAALIALRNGTTTLADSGPSGFAVGAAGDAGLRATVHMEIFGRDTGADAREKVTRHGEALLAARDAAGPRVQVGVSPHSPYTVGPELWAEVLADPILGDGAIAAHVAESPDEVMLLDEQVGPLVQAIRSVGRDPARWPGGGPGVVSRLQAAGALRPGLVAAHCVQVDEGDAAILADHDVRVAHCPHSNVRLECGDAPVEMLDALGVIVGLGTDSPASAGAYDLRDEARWSAEAAARRGTRPVASDMLALATLGSARVLGVDAEVGSLVPGKRADIVAIRPFEGAPTQADPSLVVLDPRSQVIAAWVDGEQVLGPDGATRLDSPAIVAAATEARQRIM